MKKQKIYFYSHINQNISECIKERKFNIISLWYYEKIIDDNILHKLLIKSCENYEIDVITFLLGLSPNLRIQNAINVTTWRDGDHDDIVRILLDYDNKNDKKWLENVPLSNASEKGNLKIVKLLLDKGINPTEQSLELALDNNHIEIAKILIKHGASVDNYEPKYFGQYMTEEKSMRHVINFLASCTDSNNRCLLEKINIKSLIAVCRSGLFDNLKTIVETGINIKKYVKLLLGIKKERPKFHKYLKSLINE
ncbi:hypothetical protein QJ857_gp0160 [Tupanvirus soda lake]|uniref:Uncharacterized protein n=2 Tax=Tupanvirus TaxID=2094720 RepID=A0A6N1NNB2_9VIRU|nr:hypothetical protein QJ857_gp0160 [Tupanvirus soda lake]QKU35864.1 hypothetical protein [Tupanvirus soda lake]